jgi:peptidyl-prolyl cis-trans isomerase C
VRLPFKLFICLCAALGCALLEGRPARAVEAPPAGRAALVNGELITGEAYASELRRVERRNLREKRAGEVNRKQVLENLIVRELLYQEARHLGVRVTAGEVAARLTELTGKMSGEAALESTLDSMGLSVDTLGVQLEKGMVLEKYLQEHFAMDAAASESEMSFYYEEHGDQFREPLRLRLSHILVKVEPGADAASREQGRLRILALAKRVSNGEDFAALAREASDCYSAKTGGDLGYFLPGQLAKKMEDEARALRPGEVSGVVEDRYGLHLLKLTELRPAAPIPLDQVKDKIRARLREEKQLKLLGPAVKRLRAAARVEILLNEDEH